MKKTKYSNRRYIKNNKKTYNKKKSYNKKTKKKNIKKKAGGARQPIEKTMVQVVILYKKGTKYRALLQRTKENHSKKQKNILEKCLMFPCDFFDKSRNNNKYGTLSTAIRVVKEYTGIELEQKKLKLLKQDKYSDTYWYLFEECPTFKESDATLKNDLEIRIHEDAGLLNPSDPSDNEECNSPQGTVWVKCEKIQTRLKDWKDFDTQENKIIHNLEKNVKLAVNTIVTRARALPAALPAAARERAVAEERARPVAEVANVKVEIEGRVGDFFKKVKEHNDYCSKLNIEYERKHDELNTIMSYLREILTEMPEIKASNRIIYEIINSLKFLSFGEEGEKLNLNTMRIQQDKWTAQAAENSKKILRSLREYKRKQKSNNRAPRPAPSAPPAPESSPSSSPAPSKTPEEIIEEWTKSATWKADAVKYARYKGDQTDNNILADYITSYSSVGGRFTCDANSQDLREGYWREPPQWGWNKPCEKPENIQPINNNYSLENITGQQNIQALYDNKLDLDNNGNYYIHEPNYIFTTGMCTKKEINDKSLKYKKIIKFITILQKNILKLYKKAYNNDINVDIQKPIDKVNDYFKNTDTQMNKPEGYYLYNYIIFLNQIFDLVSHDTVHINEKQLIYDMFLLLKSYYNKTNLETSSQSIIKKYLRTSV
tara:strand:+ start:1253 stop:3226 length:1974 start_codon:yes stop_codon:yes gene_type:complete